MEITEILLVLRCLPNKINCEVPVKLNYALGRVSVPHFFNAHPDPAFYLKADQNPGFQLISDPDPAPYQSDGNRPLVVDPPVVQFLPPHQASIVSVHGLPLTWYIIFRSVNVLRIPRQSDLQLVYIKFLIFF
jgi:hypothetical protein